MRAFQRPRKNADSDEAFSYTDTGFLFVSVETQHMSVRSYLRSPVSIAWTFIGALGAVCISIVTILTWDLIVRSTTVITPAILDGFGGFVVVSLLVSLAVFLVGLLWLPCSLAIAYAVGSLHHGVSVSFGDSITLLRRRMKPLYRLVKTRLAVGPIADRLLTEDDVAPIEIAVGCDAFVVPALALDASTLRLAVGRANQAVPQPGRERTLLVGLGVTVPLLVGSVAVGTFTAPDLSVDTRLLAVGSIAIGAVFTATLDIVWRTETYVQQDLDDGFY